MGFGMRLKTVKRHGLGTAARGILAVLPMVGFQAGAQATASSTAQTPAAQTPVAPVERRPLTAGGPGAAVPATGFPAPDPRNFTASSPSVDTVNSFLHALWGFDENRIWSVAAI